MGDDTWMTVFPDTFDVQYPYDSFNVEDLHTVDNGVIEHLFPILDNSSQPFDFLIGHFLGVDHVGHRVGPDHPSMLAKLQQMDNVLRRVVDKMDEDTLLVVLGDHGMDRSGDHGGDGVLETSSGMWIYSKGVELTDANSGVADGLLQYKVFPGAEIRHRSIQQIDIVPTLSLLLGLPIPFNNLGTVIPELFWRGKKGKILEKALQINAAQIMSYLEVYRTSPSGGELDDSWKNIKAAWSTTLSSGLTGDAKLVTLTNFNRVALAACRSMWAQFNPLLMALGLLLLSMSVCASWSIYSGFSRFEGDWNSWLHDCMMTAGKFAFFGSVLGTFMYFIVASYIPGVSVFDCALFTAFLASSIGLIISSPPDITFKTLKSTPFILIIHSLAFLSNSFTFWEDRIVPFLLVTSLVPYFMIGITAPNKRLRYRIIGFSVLCAICVRLISISTVCREEQQPYCRVTFFASSSLPSPPLLVLYLGLPATIGFPYIITRFLRVTKSDNGIAAYFLPLVLTPALCAGLLYWILEWVDSASIFGVDWTAALRVGRTVVARVAFGWIIIGGGVLWWLVPLCLNIEVKHEGEKKQVQVLGFANAFGAPYLIFWTISLCLVYIATQLTGQLVLAAATVALLAFLEVVDSVRDVKAMEAAFASATPSSVLDLDATAALAPPLQFADIIPIALLGLHAFYGTGHQATISSLQWKSAFQLTPTLAYPFSVVTVVLNSVGPVFLFALAAPLAGLWNRAPRPATRKSDAGDVEAHTQVKRDSTLAALGVMIYYAALLLGTAVSAAVLRRHLMVWKVFAPRFIGAVFELLAVDMAVLIGAGVGVERVVRRVTRLFKGVLRRCCRVEANAN